MDSEVGKAQNGLCSRWWASPVSAGLSGTFLQRVGFFNLCFLVTGQGFRGQSEMDRLGSNWAGGGNRKSSFVSKALPEMSHYFLGGGRAPYGFGLAAATALRTLAWTFPLDTVDVSVFPLLFHGHPLLLGVFWEILPSILSLQQCTL